MPGLFDDIPAATPPSAQPAAKAGLFDDIPVAQATAAAAKPSLFDDIPADPSTPGVSFASGDPLGDLETMGPPPEGGYKPISKAVGRAVDLNEKVAKGMTLGWAPRLGAFVDSDPIGKAFGLNKDAPTYDQALADRNATDQRISQEMPGASKIAEGFGGMLGMAAPGGAIANAARAATIPGRVIVGALTGGGTGAIQGASQSSDLTDVGQTAQKAASGAETGLEFGAALPFAGAAIGAGYRAVAPYFSQVPSDLNRMAAFLLGNATNSQTADRLASLAPHGMLADAAPSTLGLAQGIASKSGPSADLVVHALANRAAGQSDRLLSSLDENLGPAFSPRQVDAMMDAQQAAASPMYQQALRNAPLQIDISPVQRQLELEQLQAKGGIARDLDGFQRLLQSPYPINGMTVPEYDATALHGAKEAMDVAIARTANQTGSAASKATGAMSRVRGALNDALQEQIPGYSAANLAWGAAERGRGAFDAGRQALKPGANTLWPQDLDHQFAPLPIEQQALMRAGARSDIGAALGTNPNDLGALHRIVGGENDFNTPKMQTLFGPDQTTNVVNDVRNEQRFAKTYNDVVGGSQSAQRINNSAMLDAADARAQSVFPKSASLTGLLTHGGEYLVRKGFGALAQASSETTRDALARVLMSGGLEASANMQAFSDALAARNQTAATLSDALAHRAALAAALTGYREATRP